MKHSEHTAADGVHVRVRLGGRLDAGWSSWFEGLVVKPLEGGQTSLEGIVADQASLHGLLARIRDLGLPLMGLEVAGTADEPVPDEASSRRPERSERPDASRSGPRPT